MSRSKDPTNRIRLVEAVYAYRDAKGWKPPYRWLAERTQIALSTIKGIGSGANTNPSVEIILKLAEVLETTPNMLLGVKHREPTKGNPPTKSGAAAKDESATKPVKKTGGRKKRTTG